MSDQQDLEKRLQKLNFKVMLQEVALRTLIHHLHHKDPTLEIPRAFEEFLTETMLQLDKDIEPRLAEEAGRYMRSFAPLPDLH